MPKQLQVGDPAPAIELHDQEGELRTLADHRGTWVLVYFYPKDDTPGCTVEACTLRDASADFAKLGIAVLGISADTTASHRKFADKFGLPFKLLADEDKRTIRAYGSWGKKKFMGREFDGILRRSILVDPEGRIARIYPKVSPAEHAEEVLADVRSAQGAPKQPAIAKDAVKGTVRPAKRAAKKAEKPKSVKAKSAKSAARKSKTKR